VTGGNHKGLATVAVASAIAVAVAVATMASGNNETEPLYCGSGMDNFHTR